MAVNDAGTITIRELAERLLKQGRSVVPPKENGSKRPDGEWKDFQSRLPTRDEVAAWYRNGRTGIGIVGGAVSGNLEMFEFEGRAVLEGVKDAYLDAALQLGLRPLLERISQGWSDRSPSGGIHLYYLVSEPVTETTELANRPATEAELATNPDEKQKLLIETRGEGGYMIVAPSCGRVHPDGAYVRLRGGPDTIATINAEERALLLDLARSFDRLPKEEVRPRQEIGHPDRFRPGDDFNQRASWAEILKPHGWEYLFTASDGNQYWRRPGRDPRRHGWSATINEYGEGVLYVHSTSTEFAARKAYPKFAAYTILEHGGDYSAAARELRRQGYGEQGGEIRHGAAEPKAEEQSGGAASARGLVFKTARQVAEETPERPEWMVEGFAACGSIAELDGPAKRSGKTTLLAHMVRATLDGLPFLGRSTRRGPVVWMTEERSTSFRETLRRAGLLEREDLYILSWVDTFGVDWPAVVEQAHSFAQQVGARLLIVDTLPSFAGLQGEEENQSGPAAEAMEPLELAAKERLAVVVTRHDRRAGGEVGESGRGSTAFTGKVDIVLHLTRTGGQGRDNLRQLEGLGRFDEIPASLMIELTEDGYQVVDSEDVKQQQARQLLLEVLPGNQEQATTLPSLWANGQPLAGHGISKGTYRTAAEQLFAEGLVAKLEVNPRKHLWWCVSNARTPLDTQESPEEPSAPVCVSNATPIGALDTHIRASAPESGLEKSPPTRSPCCGFPLNTVGNCLKCGQQVAS